MDRGFFYFTSAIGGQTPCWSPLRSTASVPPLPQGTDVHDSSITAASNADKNPDIEDDEAITLAVDNVVFSRHYPVDGPKPLSLGASIGIALGISASISAISSFGIWLCHKKRRQRKALMERLAQRADRDNYASILGGPHYSNERLFQGPPQELDNMRPDYIDERGYADPEALERHYYQHIAPHFVNDRYSISGTNADFAPEGPPPVHIPRRVSSAAAAATNLSSQIIASCQAGFPSVKNDGYVVGAHAVAYGDGKGSNGEHLPLDSKGGPSKGAKEEEDGHASSSAVGSSSHDEGHQQQRQSHQPVAVPDRRESGHEHYEEEEGHHEPPPEYREF